MMEDRDQISMSGVPTESFGCLRGNSAKAGRGVFLMADTKPQIGAVQSIFVHYGKSATLWSGKSSPAVPIRYWLVFVS